MTSKMKEKYLKLLSEELRFNFSTEELKTYEIYRLFKYYSRKYLHVTKNYLPKKRDPRRSSNWKYFDFVREICSKYDSISMEKYVLAQILWCKNFSNPNICTPKWLASDKAIDRYSWFLRKGDAVLESLSNSDDIDIENIKQTARFLYQYKFENKFKTFAEMFLHKKGDYPNIYGWIIFSKIDKLFLSISKSYLAVYDKLSEEIKRDLPSPDVLMSVRGRIVLNSRLKSFCIKVFKEESILQ